MLTGALKKWGLCLHTAITTKTPANGYLSASAAGIRTGRHDAEEHIIRLVHMRAGNHGRPNIRQRQMAPVDLHSLSRVISYSHSFPSEKVMDKLILEIVGATAWPLTLVAIALILRPRKQK
jgi:hypothetical protein